MKKDLINLAIAGMLVGGLSACSEELETSTAAPTDAFILFKQECEAKGGTYQFNETCAAAHECNGLAISKAGVVNSTCAGKTSCDGSAVCNGVETTSSAVQATSSTPAAVTPLAKFMADCEGTGELVTHDCKGHNDCKGLSIEESGVVTEHVCKGQANCKGTTCITG